MLFAGYLAIFTSFFTVISQASSLWAEWDPGCADPSAWGSRAITCLSVSNVCATLTLAPLAARVKSRVPYMQFLSAVFLLVSLSFAGTFLAASFAPLPLNDGGKSLPEILPRSDGANYAFLLLLAAVPGAAFGLCMCLFPCVITETYGPANFGKFYGWVLRAGESPVTQIEFNLCHPEQVLLAAALASFAVFACVRIRVSVWVYALIYIYGGRADMARFVFLLERSPG